MSSVYDFEDEDVLQSSETVNSRLGKIYHYRILVKACRECNFKIVILHVRLQNDSMFTVTFASKVALSLENLKESPFPPLFKI